MYMCPIVMPANGQPASPFILHQSTTLSGLHHKSCTKYEQFLYRSVDYICSGLQQHSHKYYEHLVTIEDKSALIYIQMIVHKTAFISNVILGISTWC